MRPTSTSYLPLAVRGIGYSLPPGLSRTSTPAAPASRSRTASGVAGRSSSSVIASLWVRRVGMRTAVQLIFRLSSPMILRVSHATFISSLVYPLSWKESMCGMTLKGMGCANTLACACSPFSSARVCSSSSSMPLAPAPLVAW